MNTDKNTKSIIVAAVIALLGTSYAVAETSQVDPATGNTLHLSGNALPDEGQSRPLFHVTQDAASGPVGLSPAQVKHFYGFDKINTSTPGAGQVIAIIDAYDDPSPYLTTPLNVPLKTISCHRKKSGVALHFKNRVYSQYFRRWFC